MADSIKEIASRLKRSMRHPDVLMLCDFVLEGGPGWSGSGPENRAMVMSHDGSTPSPSATTTTSSGGFDRKTYQRVYMRQWRARQRQGETSGSS